MIAITIIAYVQVMRFQMLSGSGCEDAMRMAVTKGNCLIFSSQPRPLPVASHGLSCFGERSKPTQEKAKKMLMIC